MQSCKCDMCLGLGPKEIKISGRPGIEQVIETTLTVLRLQYVSIELPSLIYSEEKFKHL